MPLMLNAYRQPMTAYDARAATHGAVSYNATRFKVDMAPYPTIARVHAALVELPEFQAAHPDKQPDAVLAP